MELALSIVRSQIEKEHISHSEAKVKLEWYKQLLVEMSKRLNVWVDDSLPSTSSLLEGDVKALIEMGKVEAIAKAWVQANTSKIRLFLQNIMEVYKKAT